MMMRHNDLYRWLWAWPRQAGGSWAVIVRFDLGHVSLGFEWNVRDSMLTVAAGPLEIASSWNRDS